MNLPSLNHMTVIVSSTQDPASTNMKSTLLDESSWIEKTTFLDAPVFQHEHINDLYMVTISDKTILHEHLEDELLNYLHIKPSRLIFLSRHRSKTGEPTLTTHPIGNYGAAEFGGQERTLTPSLPSEMARLLRIIRANAGKEGLVHQVCYEVTHHGPLLRTPTLFAEVGSDEEQWNNKDACRVVALSVLELLENEIKGTSDKINDRILVGIGGGHYAPRFTDVCFNKQAAFGHMIPSYQIKTGGIDTEMVSKALDATPDVSGVYMHRKAMKKSEASFFKNVCEGLGVPVLTSDDLADLMD
jgi:D-aminoacyl-tRNA deacylase